MYRLVFLLLLILLLTFVSTLHSTIIHVPADSTTIQGGINGAVDGDTVMVSPGTYYEHDIDFLGKAITVMGTDPGNWDVVESTVVNGGARGSIFIFMSGEDTRSVLTGLTMTNGRSEMGAAVNCSGVSPTISHNIMRDNEAPGSYPAGRGGAIYMINSSPCIVGNRMIGNISGDKGGAIMVESSSPHITNNLFEGNQTVISGGGIRTYTSSPTIVGNLFVNNHSNTHGGGISTHVSSGSLIINNTLVGNSVDYSGGGGGITCTGSPTVLHCILWNNTPWQIDGSPDVGYSDIERGWSSGKEIIDSDPLFITLGSFEYFLGPGSPCIDTEILTTSAEHPTEDRISDWHPQWPNWIPNGPQPDMGTYGGPENAGWFQ
jgi:hypothetical protein